MRQRSRLYYALKPLIQTPKKNEVSFYAIIEGRQAGPIKEKELKKFISYMDLIDSLMYFVTLVLLKKSELTEFEFS